MKLAIVGWLALVATAQAANIDNDGFLQDRKTTYCQPLTNDQTPFSFRFLSPISGSKCPVNVEITANVRSYGMTETLFDVSWSASVAATNSSILLDGLRSSNVSGGVLRACRVGSNCASANDIVTPSLVGQPSLPGAFGPTDTRDLGSFLFTLPGPNLFVIVGKITVGTTELLAFKRVASTARPASVGTVKPPDANGQPPNTTASNATTLEATSSPQPTTAQPGMTLGLVGVDAQDDHTGGISSPSSSFSTQTIVLIGVIACVALVGAAVLVVTARVHKTLSNTLDSAAFDEREADTRRYSPVANLREQRHVVPIPDRVEIHQGEFEMYPQHLYSFAASSEDATSSRAPSDATVDSSGDLSASAISN